MSTRLSRRAALRYGLSAAAGALAAQPAFARGDDPWANARRIRDAIRAPAIPGRAVSIRDFGAVADGATLNTAAIAAAIEACARAGGGRVVVPPGRFLTGAVHLRSRVELHLQRGAVLLFSTDPADYPLVFTRYEGVELYNYSPLIYARDAHDVAVTGHGLLDGQGANDNWWSWCGAERFGWREGMPRQQEDRARLFQMAEQGRPVGERIFGPGHYIRPNFIQFYNCDRVLLQGLRVRNAPCWTVHPVASRDVVVRDLDIAGHGPNTDGCDPESVDGMLIENCRFDNGDDCIAIKSGRNADGRRLAAPSQNIVIRGCVMKAGHGGVVIGSEISGGARNIFAERCAMDSPDLWYALRFKNNAVRGGVVEDVFVRDIDVGQVGRAAITCDFNYEEGAAGAYTPVLRNVLVERLHVRRAARVLDSQGLPHAPVRDITLRDCSFAGVTEPSIVTYTEGLTLERVRVNGRRVAGL